MTGWAGIQPGYLRQLVRMRVAGEPVSQAANAWLYPNGPGNGEVRLWDTKAASELHCHRGHTKPISRLAFSPDGRYALSSAEDGVRLLGSP